MLVPIAELWRMTTCNLWVISLERCSEVVKEQNSGSHRNENHPLWTMSTVISILFKPGFNKKLINLKIITAMKILTNNRSTGWGWVLHRVPPCQPSVKAQPESVRETKASPNDTVPSFILFFSFHASLTISSMAFTVTEIILAFLCCLLRALMRLGVGEKTAGFPRRDFATHVWLNLERREIERLNAVIFLCGLLRDQT